MRKCEDKYNCHLVKSLPTHGYCLTCGKLFKECAGQ